MTAAATTGQKDRGLLHRHRRQVPMSQERDTCSAKFFWIASVASWAVPLQLVVQSGRGFSRAMSISRRPAHQPTHNLSRQLNWVASLCNSSGTTTRHTKCWEVRFGWCFALHDPPRQQFMLYAMTGGVNAASRWLFHWQSMATSHTANARMRLAVQDLRVMPAWHRSLDQMTKLPGSQTYKL
jgi:hypothetical protein